MDAFLDIGEHRRQLAELRIAHRRLDERIAALIDGGETDQLELQRLKKEKLRLRDRIVWLESARHPDIIA